MKIRIDRKHKVVGVIVHDIVEAGHLGFNFARMCPDLTKEGWTLYYYDNDMDLRRGHPDVATVAEVNSCSARAIRNAMLNLCPEYKQPRPQG